LSIFNLFFKELYISDAASRGLVAFSSRPVKGGLERIEMCINALKIINAKVWEISGFRRGIRLTPEDGIDRPFPNVNT
jgi:hypothetical protein